MSCECGGTQEQKDRRRFKTIAAGLPLLRGTIIKEDGTRVDISDLFDIPVSKADPQLARSQQTFPYMRDTILLEDGRVCLLSDLVAKISKDLYDASVVYTHETRFDRVQLSASDWSSGAGGDVPDVDDLEFYSHVLKEEDWAWQ